MKRLLPYAAALLFGTTLLCGALWIVASQDLARLRAEIRLPMNAAFEQRAVREEAKYQQVTVATIERLSLPLTVRLSERICVELRSRWGVTDGGTVYCFDKRSGRIVERFISDG